MLCADHATWIEITEYDYLPIVDGYESHVEHGHSHRQETEILDIFHVRSAKRHRMPMVVIKTGSLMIQYFLGTLG